MNPPRRFAFVIKLSFPACQELVRGDQEAAKTVLACFCFPTFHVLPHEASDWFSGPQGARAACFIQYLCVCLVVPLSVWRKAIIRDTLLDVRDLIVLHIFGVSSILLSY